MKIEGVPVFALKFLFLQNGSAFTIPGLGIFISEDRESDIGLLRHEFGHVLQYKEKGFFYFWIKIVPISVCSAFLSAINKNHNHMEVWTEWTANRLSFDYFKQPTDWDFKRFPIYD